MCWWNITIESFWYLENSLFPLFQKKNRCFLSPFYFLHQMSVHRKESYSIWPLAELVSNHESNWTISAGDPKKAEFVILSWESWSWRIQNQDWAGMLDSEDERTTALSEHWGNTRQGQSAPCRQTWISATPLWKLQVSKKESVTETSWFQKKYSCNIAYVPQTILNAFVPKHFL